MLHTVLPVPNITRLQWVSGTEVIESFATLCFVNPGTRRVTSNTNTSWPGNNSLWAFLAYTVRTIISAPRLQNAVNHTSAGPLSLSGNGTRLTAVR
jgi:hypothetical protein